MTAIPTSPMNRALTDKERKAVKAEYLRLAYMLQDDSMYWRRGETPPPPQPKPKSTTAADIRSHRPDLWERTKLQKGDPQRLTLPKAKAEAQKVKLLPPGEYFWKRVGTDYVQCSYEEYRASQKAEPMSVAHAIVGRSREGLSVNPVSTKLATRPGWTAWGDQIGRAA